MTMCHLRAFDSLVNMEHHKIESEGRQTERGKFGFGLVWYGLFICGSRTHHRHHPKDYDCGKEMLSFHELSSKKLLSLFIPKAICVFF